MKITIPFRIQKVPGVRAQAMVEFALVLMILMVILVGLLEVGRLMFMYAAVNNASREAARYASAIGLDDSGTYLKYQHCEGIVNMAKRSAFFAPSLAVNITYDHGPGTSIFGTCDSFPAKTSISVNSGTNLDRVYVTVSANYSPMVNLIPIGSRTLTSSSARTILGYTDLEDPSSSSAPTSTSSVPSTATAGPSPTATATVPADTPTSTATTSGEVIATATLWPTSTPSLVPTVTSTATATSTPTETLTPTLTFTPTSTPTAKPGCDSITTGSIIFSGKVMSLYITNPHDIITIGDVQVTWNSAGNSKGLILKSISLGGATFWAGSATGGYFQVSPTSVTIPGNNQTSQIAFTFDNAYQTQNNAESIVISLSTPGCEGITIHKP